MKSFYDFYTKLQKLNEENTPVNAKVMDNLPSPDAMAQNNSLNGKDATMNAPNSDETPKLVDKSQEGESEEESNLSPPEGKINYKLINKNLKHITKNLSKFKNLDEEKGEQLEQLIDQISNLINSFDGATEETSDDASDENEDLEKPPEADDSATSQDLKKSPDISGGVDMTGGIDMTGGVDMSGGAAAMPPSSGGGSMPQSMNLPS